MLQAPARTFEGKLNFPPSRDNLWCVGDIVNRGPRSLETLRFLQDIDDSVKIVLGNHDLHFIAMHEGCAPPRTKDTLSKLLNARDCHELSDWLRQKPLVYFDCLDTINGLENFLMVHAGVAPSLVNTENLKSCSRSGARTAWEKLSRVPAKYVWRPPALVA